MAWWWVPRLSKRCAGCAAAAPAPAGMPSAWCAAWPDGPAWPHAAVIVAASEMEATPQRRLRSMTSSRSRVRRLAYDGYVEALSRAQRLFFVLGAIFVTSLVVSDIIGGA